MRKIGFIGVGIMGKSMVRNLMKAGFELHIFARNMAKVTDVIGEGAIFHSTIADCVKDAEVVITIVGFPPDVEEVYFKAGNILDSANKNAYLIDMTTTSPSLAEKIYEAGTAKGFHVMDAPVTGGDTGAKNGTLSIMVGGEQKDFDECLPLFRAMGTNIVYHGKAGSGQHAKLANQIMIAGAMSGLCEALAYAQAKGLNLGAFLKSTATGSAGSKQLDMFGPRILEGNFAPGFFMKHFIKDMKLASEEAAQSDLKLNMLNTVLEEYKELEARGMGNLGTQALIKYFEPRV
ncbi:MAG: NAD(P)-dependent oxidoreductase [Synergistaceae bacterium]|nr:NAD(P)-dependent oxidoreductase [Synergistaceae bacterium]